uniref:R-FOM-2 n=1 Tax=Cucumis melo TaxID=3656 RepID=Q2V727_CUCME|nr:R-FOM-2 [Cucumis melo]
MGDFLWTFAVEEMLKKVLKVAREQTGLAWGFQKHLSKLQKWLLKAEAFLRNINTRKLHHDSVRMWVDDLRHLVYQADDLLDEIVYEDLRQKVQTRKMKKVCDFFSPSTNVLIFRLNMAKKMMTLIALLEKHYLEAAPLGLVGNENVSPEIDVISQYRETISELEDHKILGRDVEVESIVKQVIDASNNQLTSILPIVGMGGLGKTTLAKLVFKHELVRQHFDKTVWVCVSEPFIVNKILLDILQNLKGGISNGGDSKEVLLRELQKEMLGQTYFLVLDDVWNENSFLWGELKYCLLKITGNSKNSIVVTTRSAEVTKIMGTCPGHLLSKLSDDHCWSLFKESANVYGLSMTSNLGIIQKELVKKIGGVPLVARVLGRTVKFEGDVEKWEETLKSVLRIPVQEEDFVLSILKLSVDRLPSSALKQCFSYCSIFPKDFVFEKQELIQMWMAQGFLQPQEGRNMTMETVGDIYFKILLSHCLFQDAHETRTEEYKMHDLVYGTRTEEYKMHDLVHDIAMAISRDQNLQLNPSNISEKELQKKEIKNVACKLRTIDFIQKIPHNIGQLTFFDVKIRNFVCLRILKISKMSSEKLPKSIDQLKHLRYLEIASYSTRLKFPESIVSLHNLQTLKFLYSFVEEFPMNFSNLVNLRHLKLWRNVDQTPPHLSQLTQLQTLSHFVIGFEEGCKIIELGPLKNLQGSSNLLCLEKVESKEEAKGANLAEKENLKELNLSWSMKRKDNDNYNDLEVLEGLQPNQNLQILRIHDFTERRLPNKIFVENLIEIGLYGCDNCEKLPMLGQLNNLKKLEICSFDGVQIIDNKFYGNDPNQRRFFPKLEKFVMQNMINLEQWEEVMTNDASSNVTIFPNLKSLEISGCPKLTKIPNGLQFCSSIRRVKIYQCSNLGINMRNKPELWYLHIGPLGKLPEDLCHLMNLGVMTIVGNIQNYDFGILQHLPSLKKITLVEDELSNNSVTQIPQQLQHLTSLEFLSIENFGGIEALPEWLGNLVCLQTLCFLCCRNLKKLPSTEAMLRLTKLNKLYACECPMLLLEEGDPERAKLSHFPNVLAHRNTFESCRFF